MWSNITLPSPVRGGDNSVDKIFILSIEEALLYFPVKENSVDICSKLYSFLYKQSYKVIKNATATALKNIETIP